VQLRNSPEIELYLNLLAKCLTGIIFDESGWQLMTKLAINGQIAAVPSDLAILRKVPLDRPAREEGRDWPFLAYTMVGVKRLRNVRDLVERILVRDLPGDLLEAGVWRGGCSIYMRGLLKAHAVTDRKVWVADSFAGMPLPGPVDAGLVSQRSDLHEEAYLAVSLEEVQENFRRFELLDGQVAFLKGWFKDTLHQAPVQRLALLRLDADFYDSTMAALDALYGRVTPGGFVIIDDYFSWEGCRRAVTEFRERHGVNSEIIPIDWSGAYWQKA